MADKSKIKKRSKIKSKLDKPSRGKGQLTLDIETENLERYAEDESLNEMLANVVNEVKKFGEDQANHIKRLSEIGIALSAEKDIDRLLEMIVDEARMFTNADGGTLYNVNEEKEVLEFAIVQNETMNTRMGGAAGAITWPAVPLKIEGKPNMTNVSSYSAITGEIVNIPDVYEAEGFDFSGTRKFDEGTGYRSKSMLVIPMRNKANEIIGILQLINARNTVTMESIPFSHSYVDLIASLASQAAVAVTNVRLYKNLEDLLEAFIKSIATAIDEKSPYTGGHIRRVQEVTMIIARKMNEQTEGPFKDFNLNDDELNELRIAAWLHDIGKITTPEHVVDKATKLETVHDRVHEIEVRYEVLVRDAEIKVQNEKLQHYEKNTVTSATFKKIDDKFQKEIKVLKEEMKFVIQCNQPGEFMEDEKVERLNEISKRKWKINGKLQQQLSDNELYNLALRKGSLNPEERKIMENHALVSIKMLEKLPFPKKLKRVPEWAGAHHEKLNGTGYPFGLTAVEISYPARIMAIADIFEALTAKDRPYKKPMPLSKALQILGFMQKDGHLDGDVLDLFMETKIYVDYAKRELDPSQIDCIDD